MIKTLLISAALISSTAYAFENPDRIRYAWTVESGDIKEVKQLLAAGMSPEYEGNVIGAGLHIAAWTGNIEMMKVFVEAGADVNKVNFNGEQPLALAAWKGNDKAVDWLLEHGAKLNRKDKSWGALHYATFNGYSDLANRLIKMGADINARTPNGATPLILAAREGKVDIAKSLLEAGADPKLRTDWNDNALIMAVRYSHFNIGKMVATQAEFANAINGGVELTGQPSRSESAPKSVAEILAKIREANMEKMPTHALQAQLSSAIQAHKDEIASKKKDIVKTSTLEITAKRSKPAEQNARLIITK